MKPKICVVGSANIDQVSYVKRAPNDGETLFGEDYQMGFGGKGANQAVMAGLLGAEVYVIACLGSDVYREMTIENFKNNNVITDYIQTVEGSSGVAPIWVDESGQNRIVVIPGANNLLDSSLAIESLEKIGKPDVLVGQFEIPMNVNEEVFSYAYKNGVQTVLNPAPANKPTDVLLENTSWFIPNEVEFEEIYGEVFNEDNLLLFANDLKTNVVVTLGEKGCAYIKNNSVEIMNTDTVKAVDTTGAGDSFAASFLFEYLVQSNLNNNGDDNNRRFDVNIKDLEPHEYGQLKVNNLKQDGLNIDSFVSDTILEVTLTNPILPGESSLFTMNFNGQIPITIRRAGRDSPMGVKYSMAQWYPKISEYDYEGWNTAPYTRREFHGVL